MSVSNNQQTANLWITIHYMGASLIPASFALYVYTFLKIEREKKFSLGIWWVIGIAFFIVTLVRRELFVSASSTKPFFAYYTQGGIFYPLYTLVFFLCVGEAILYLIKNLKGRHSVSAKHVQYVLTASIVGFGGGATAFLPVFDLNIYPYGMLFVFLYPVIMTYAIVRHRLMDIEVIIKRTLVFAGMFGMVMVTAALVTTFLQQFMSRFVVIPVFFSTALSVALAILLYDPTRRFLVRVTDNYLFQKREDFKVILNRLSEQVITILDIKELSRTILSTLESSLRLESGAIVVQGGNRGRYSVLNGFGIKEGDLKLEQEDSLIRFFKTFQGIVNLETIERGRKFPAAVKERLAKFNAVIAVPLFMGKELTGILFLGRKRSDQEYTQDEIEYFPTVAGEVAIALSNAHHYDEAVKRRKEAEESREEALAAKKKTEEMELEKALKCHIEALTPIHNSIIQLFIVYDTGSTFAEYEVRYEKENSGNR